MKKVILVIALWCQLSSGLAYAAFPNSEDFKRQQQCAARKFSNSPSYVNVTVQNAISGESFESVVTSRELAEAIATEFDLRPKAGEENPPGTVMSEEVANLFSQFKILRVLATHPDLHFKFSLREAIDSLRPSYDDALLSDIREQVNEMSPNDLLSWRFDNEAVRKLIARYAGFDSGREMSAVAHVLLERGVYPFVQDLGQTLGVEREPCEMQEEVFLGHAIVEVARLGYDFSVLSNIPPGRLRISWPHEFKQEQRCAALNFSSSPSYVVVHITDEESEETFTSVVESTFLHQAIATEFGMSPVEQYVKGIVQLIADHEDLRFEFRKQEAIALLRPRYTLRHLEYARAALSGESKQDIIAKFAGQQRTQDFIRADDNYWSQIDAAAYVLLELALYPSRDDISPTLRVKPSPCELNDEGARIKALVQKNVSQQRPIQSFR